MKSTLTINDLSASKELDGKAMSAVRGGLGDQANGLSQLNFENLIAANNVGVGAKTGFGPLIIQSDIDNSQTAANSASLTNNKSAWFDFIRAF